MFAYLWNGVAALPEELLLKNIVRIDHISSQLTPAGPRDEVARCTWTGDGIRVRCRHVAAVGRAQGGTGTYRRGRGTFRNGRTDGVWLYLDGFAHASQKVKAETWTMQFMKFERALMWHATEVCGCC